MAGAGKGINRAGRRAADRAGDFAPVLPTRGESKSDERADYFDQIAGEFPNNFRMLINCVPGATVGLQRSGNGTEAVAPGAVPARAFSS